MKKQKKIVMAFGTFDIFHKGHESYLKQARELGDRLIVVVARDKNVARIKKQIPKNNEQKRLRMLEKSKLADEVILGDSKNKYGVIEKYRPDILAVGYDQEFNQEEVTEKLKSLGLNSQIVRLKSFRPEIYKSSKLKF